MLRNKIGKPSQPPASTQSNKNTQTKPANNLSNVTGIKAPSGIVSGIGIGGIKPTTLMGVKPQIKHPVNNLTATQSQGAIAWLAKKDSSLIPQVTQTKTQQKSQSVRPQQMKTEQQRLAQLVTKKAAEMKKEYEMINKISSQVGSEKKSYIKEYEAKFSHVLKLSKKIFPKNKENTLNSQKEIIPKDTKQQLSSKKSDILWKLNQCHSQNNLKQYLLSNFKPDKYM